MEKIFGQVGEYLGYCERVRGMSEATMRAKRNVLWRFVRVTGVRAVEQVDNAAFNRWVEFLTGRGVRARSVNTYNSIVLAMVRYYREAGMKVPVNLAMVAKLKGERGRREFYTAEEISRVLAYADEQTGLMIRVMFETGMRIAELCRLRREDFDGRRVRFVGKGWKMREVYVTEGTLRLLGDFWRRQGVTTGYLWRVSEVGEMADGCGPLSTQTVRKYLRRPFAEAGFVGFYPHALRHSFATDLQRRGASVAEIKEMIGHASVATTERYLHGFEGRMRELFDKYR